MFYIVSGRLRIPELGIDMMPDEFVGELGLLAPDGRRTESVECVETANVLAIRYDEVHELIFQNPDFGLYFMKLASERLFNVVRLQGEELATRKSEADTGNRGHD